ncbi:phosphatase PAP2 family protein [Sabulicella glaciei]|uniref:Phosphatase PAP2 family protein n=1 Tax=Sabulicella glaciei TaxID=2984948 RepID=A0ABT3NYW1_9PROT|nr:phosphatase PAP2 family protein [Roseococcus sp. MDT2-1-1]MCW8087341.1 phosphatase PAP2 family protein [Roseococcus sp. MDT2-1-1]
MTRMSPSRRALGAALLLGSSFVLSGTGLAQPRQGAQPAHPGTWQTWVLTSGQQFRLPPPPNAAATRAELDQLRGMVASRDAETLQRIAWWSAAAPSYRWNQIAMDEALQAGVPVNLASRHLALLHTALADAMVAAWDSKQAHNRARPGTTDPALRPVAAPASPSYPDEHAVAAGAAAAILAEIFPRRAAEFTRLAEEAGRLRQVAGAAYPSDVAAGTALGRQVAAVALERARRDGTDQRWTGTVPAQPGQWNAANPALPQAPNWAPWLLSSAAEFRPRPPPAADSPERATEMAQLRTLERTPLTSARAIFWEAAAGGLRSHEYWNNHVGRLLFEHGQSADAPRAARAYALLNVAMFDSGIACWDAKYAYWTIRPTQLDREFRPVIAVPNHPSYPSAHGCFSTSAARVIGHLFPREAATMASLAREAGASRIWAGIHYPSDVTAADALGRSVAERAIQRAVGDGSDAAPR